MPPNPPQWTGFVGLVWAEIPVYRASIFSVTVPRTQSSHRVLISGLRDQTYRQTANPKNKELLHNQNVLLQIFVTFRASFLLCIFKKLPVCRGKPHPVDPRKVSFLALTLNRVEIRKLSHFPPHLLSQAP